MMNTNNKLQYIFLRMSIVEDEDRKEKAIK